MLRDKNKGFGNIPQQAKIDEFIRSESKRICQFFVSAYALTVLAAKEVQKDFNAFRFMIFKDLKFITVKRISNIKLYQGKIYG